MTAILCSSKEIKLLMNELDEEKRIRLTLQVRFEKTNTEEAVISQTQFLTWAEWLQNENVRLASEICCTHGLNVCVLLQMEIQRMKKHMAKWTEMRTSPPSPRRSWVLWVMWSVMSIFSVFKKKSSTLSWTVKCSCRYCFTESLLTVQRWGRLEPAEITQTICGSQHGPVIQSISLNCFCGLFPVCTQICTECCFGHHCWFKTF